MSIKFIKLVKRIFFGSRPKKIVEGLTIGQGSRMDGSVDIRKKGGLVEIGNNSLVSALIATETSQSKIVIGNKVFIGGSTIIDCVQNITIEDNVLVSYQCIIQDSDNHSTKFSLRQNDVTDWMNGQYHNWEVTPTKPIKICRGAWIGARAIILKGVTLGEGCVVGAGSVVTKSVAPWTIVAGNPAKVIREIPVDER